MSVHHRSSLSLIGKSLFLVLLSASLITVGCGGENDDGPRTFERGGGGDGNGEEERTEEAVPVEVASVERGRIEATLRFSANLEAERDVQIFAEAPRRVTERLVEEGHAVNRGQLLLRLENLEQQSTLAKVESQLEKAHRELKRQESLFNQNLISEQLYNDASYDVEQLELSLNDAKRELAYTEVRAPIGGIVTERLVNIGDYVTLNQPLFRVVDFDSIVARIYVPENDLRDLAERQPARLTADAIGEASFKGSIDRISPVVDPGTGTVKVTVATPRQEGLRPGMFVEVELVTAIHEDAVLLPKRALVYDNDQVFAFRLGEERRVERVSVVPALESIDWIEPDGGIDMGDQIVVAGQSGLKDGALVRLPGDPDPEEETEDDDSDEENVEETDE
ncbi:MAG: efflux RND transporter periplasmic adaptor subunit [bacterium]|nr:efflux RND transporter periplasmic adaptor subunit [bacterium]